MVDIVLMVVLIAPVRIQSRLINNKPTAMTTSVSRVSKRDYSPR